MSRISQDFINNVGCLYEEINIQQEDFLNEESQHYDAEATELVEDILSTISSMMVHEGHSAEGIIGFLADSSEETIIEKYLSFDENVLTESVVSEDYIVEQLEIFDAALNEGLGTLIGKVAKGAIGLAGRVASKPARMAVAKKMMQSANPARTAAAVERLSARKVAKAGLDPAMVKNAPDLATKVRMGVTAPIKGVVTKAVQKVKDIAKGAKAALPKIAKGAGIFGLGAAGGYVGAKMAGAGSGTKAPEAAKPKPGDDKPPVSAKPPTSAKPAPSAKPAADSDAAINKKYDELRKTDPAAAEKYGLEQWKKKFPNLAKNLNPDGTQKGTGQSEMEKGAEELRKMSERSKQRQGELMGGPEGPGKIDTKSADEDLKAQQKRDKERADKALRDSQSSMKESYEPYEVLLEYLMSGGHADTIEEAHYIMLEMDASAVRAVMEEYEDYLLAEKVSEWVDGLLDEGYDLSEYSWDDVVEYYVTEAKYGTAKGRKALAKKVRAGKDVGKKGAGFEAIVDKASGKYGKERATKIAAAAMWKTYGGKKGKTQKEY